MSDTQSPAPEVASLEIPEVLILRPKRHSDRRGFFSETYNKRALAQEGLDIEFVQDNHSLSSRAGTLRGLHFQIPPHAQTKLIRVVHGAIFDVVLDIRAGSPSFGRHVCATITAENWNQVLVPIGFAHGFCTLEADTELLYKTSDYYSPDHDKGLLWNDPALGISWPLPEAKAVLSAKDRAQPMLADLPEYFVYEPMVKE